MPNFGATRARTNFSRLVPVIGGNGLSIGHERKMPLVGSSRSVDQRNTFCCFLAIPARLQIEGNALALSQAVEPGSLNG